MSNKISVIIPTYNRANLLPRAIESVLKQTFTNFELIIVDDCSIDNTTEVVKEFLKKDKRIKYIRLNKNSGSAAYPRNIGIQRASGEYIAFLDSDDEWLPEKLEKQIQLFRNSSNNLGFVGCNAIVIDKKSNKITEYKTPQHGYVFKELLVNDFILNPSSILIKKKVFNKIGFFDENLKIGEDWDMWIRIAQWYEFDFVPQPLFKYYSHDNNITKITTLKEKEKNIEYLIKKHRKDYELDYRLLSIYFRKKGSASIIEGNLHKGQIFLLKSIILNPLNIKSYFYLIVSFLGSNTYCKLEYFKEKIISMLRLK